MIVMTIAQRYKKCASPLGQGCRARLVLALSIGFYKEGSSSLRLAIARISKSKSQANDPPKPLGTSTKKRRRPQEVSPELSVTPSEGYPSTPWRVSVTPLIPISQHAEGYQSGGADIRQTKLPPIYATRTRSRRSTQVPECKSIVEKREQQTQARTSKGGLRF